jgi:hypothetical protein
MIFTGIGLLKICLAGKTYNLKTLLGDVKNVTYEEAITTVEKGGI